MYGFRFDRDAQGTFYVKQRAEDGDMIALPDVAQDRRRFATWQEAKTPAEKWAQAANDPRILKVCNPTYQERRLDGVMAHLELDPKHGTILVPDTGCKDRYELDRAANAQPYTESEVLRCEVCGNLLTEREVAALNADTDFIAHGDGHLIRVVRNRYEIDRAALVADAAEAVDRFGEDELEAYAARTR